MADSYDEYEFFRDFVASKYDLVSIKKIVKYLPHSHIEHDLGKLYPFVVTKIFKTTNSLLDIFVEEWAAPLIESYYAHNVSDGIRLAQLLKRAANERRPSR